MAAGVSDTLWWLEDLVGQTSTSKGSANVKFTVGDRVEKIGGSYQALGWIVAAFRTRVGAERYVFEFDVPSGMLHIFGPDQLVRRER
jgi:hypothetical protein